MSFDPTDTTVKAWKRQMDTGLRVAEAFVEGAERAREIQLGAAVDAHAWLEATRKALAGELDATALIALQVRLASENLGKVADYWSRLGANARDTQAHIVSILAEGAQPAAGVPRDALSSIVDEGYKKWLQTLNQLYAIPGAAGVKSTAS